MYPRVGYYRHGFKKHDVLMSDCHKIEREFYEFSGLDKGVDDATMMADFRGRITRIFALGRTSDASDIHGHGTHVAGSVLGNGSNSNRKICGVAPAAKLVFQSIMGPFPKRNLLGIPHNLGNGLFDIARDSGAAIHSNSWGDQ
jgi:serine protease AprX